MVTRSKSEKKFAIGVLLGLVLVTVADYLFNPSQEHLMARYRYTQWAIYYMWAVGFVLACAALWAVAWPHKNEQTVTLDESSITFTESDINLVLDCENSDVPEFDKIVYISRAELLFKEELRIQSLIADKLPGLRIRWK